MRQVSTEPDRVEDDGLFGGKDRSSDGGERSRFAWALCGKGAGGQGEALRVSTFSAVAGGWCGDSYT